MPRDEEKDRAYEILTARENKSESDKKYIERMESADEEMSKVVDEMEGEVEASPEGTPYERAVERARREAELSPEEALELRKERKAKMAQVLTRGLINDRLADIPDLPSDVRAVWIRERDEDIAYFKGLGYWVETEFGEKFVDHDRGDNIRRMGDTILMCIHRHDYELLEEVEQERKRQVREAPGEQFLDRVEGANVRGIEPIVG